MGAGVKAGQGEDISRIIASMIQPRNNIDLSRMLTQENMFDAAVLRAFLLDLTDDGDLEEFFAETNLDGAFVRGLMAGLVLSILIQKTHGEILGRPSHAEVAAIFDCAGAYLIESAI
jgi:hypothetical protein